MTLLERLTQKITTLKTVLRAVYRQQPGIPLVTLSLLGVAGVFGGGYISVRHSIFQQIEQQALTEAEIGALLLDLAISEHRRALATHPPAILPHSCDAAECLGVSSASEIATDIQGASQLRPSVNTAAWPQLQSESQPVSDSREAKSDCPNCLQSPFLPSGVFNNLPLKADLGQGSFWVVLNNSGEQVFPVDPKWVGQQEDPHWQDFAQVVTEGGQGIAQLRLKGERMYVAHTPLSQGKGSIGLAIPHRYFNRHLIRMDALMSLLGLGGIATLALVGLAIGNFRRAERTKVRLKVKKTSTEIERQSWRAGQRHQQQQMSALQQEITRTISDNMAGPLTNLKQAVVLMTDYGLGLHPVQVERYIRVMEQEVSKLVYMFDRIICFRNLESASLVLSMAPVDLQQFCEDLVARCQQDLSKRAHLHRVELSFSGTCGTVYLDCYLVTLVLEPILRNAMRYSSNHPEMPAIIFTVDTSHAGRIEFRVSDRGVGIPEQDLEEVFKPFVRGSNVMHQPGTGVGLAIAKQAIDAMQGELTIVSRLFVGTTVTAVVPVGDAGELVTTQSVAS